MSEDGDAKAFNTADDAYEAAAAEAPAPTVSEPVEAPVAEAASPAVEAEAPVTAKPKAKAAKAKVVPAEPVVEAKPARKVAKRRATKSRVKAAALARKPTVRKSVSRKSASGKAAAPAVAAKSAPVKSQHTVVELKEKIMATAKKTKPEYTKLLETAQTKAKQVYAKSATVAAEVSAFSKGNAEAVVASGKILGEGVKGMGKDYVTEAKSAFETLTGDLKALAGVKSPTELFQLQGKLARRNFDQAVAYGSKTSESLVKLANEVFAPISNRVSLAVDKVSKAA